MSTPRLPRQMEAVRISGVDDDGNPAGQIHLVDRNTQPVYGSGLTESVTTNIDASVEGVTELVPRMIAVVPPHGLRLAGSVEIRASWEVRSAAAAGSFAHLQARVVLVKANGTEEPVAGPFGFISRDIATTGRIWNERIGGTLPDPDSLPIRYESGDRVEVVLEMEVTTANGGDFDVGLHHDPTSNPDRLFVEWMTGEQ